MFKCCKAKRESSVSFWHKDFPALKYFANSADLKFKKKKNL